MTKTPTLALLVCLCACPTPRSSPTPIPAEPVASDPEPAVPDDPEAADPSEPTGSLASAVEQQWRLPRVSSLTWSLVRYPEPRQVRIGPKRVAVSEVIEFVVETDAPLPADRAVSPVLWVGTTIVSEFRLVEGQGYVFTAYDIDALEDGAGIGLGWPQFPQDAQSTGEHYSRPAK